MNELQTTNELITTRSIEIVSSNYCRDCGSPLTYNDNFCGNCGTACRDLIVGQNPASQIGSRIGSRIGSQSDGQATEIATVDNTTVTLQSVVNNRLAVAGMIACFGPVGLLALWFSQRFSTRAKIITTASYVLLAIVAPLVAIWYWMSVALLPIVDVLGQ